MWLWGALTRSEAPPLGVLHGLGAEVQLCRLVSESTLGAELESLRGRIVLLLMREQLNAALAMIELDGVAKRLILCTPDLQAESIAAVIREAAADACVIDEPSMAANKSAITVTVQALARPRPKPVERRVFQATEWILLTSATTGAPKLVQHSLAGLTSAFADQVPRRAVWSTFYDIRRYGGLQILLRGLYSGGMVLSSAAEPVEDFLTRAGNAGVTHMTGTASHWRRALMSGAAGKIKPQYVRLSGEIADQAILDALHAAYPHATVAHAFATTEAGVAFEVEDGLAGFPEGLMGATGSKVEMKITDGTLRVRSAGCAVRYLDDGAPALHDADGFVDTGDRVELRNGRYHFMGRSGGVINVGGLKVYPEEIESVINAHSSVRMSLVKSRRSPITGAVVTAEVVLADSVLSRGARSSERALAQQILEHCRQSLPAWKVPVSIRFVASLELTAAGKLRRCNA